jgi:glycosyltransferase involved in cell wall biosynthesis
MEIWFVHKRFPGHYEYLARYFSKRSDCRVVGIGGDERAQVEGIRRCFYENSEPASRHTHAYVRKLETSVRRSVAAARLAIQLKKEGLKPDIICSHHSWGDTLFFRDIFPDAKFLTYQEFIFRSQGMDPEFDPEFGEKHKLDAMCKKRMWNAVGLLSLDLADWNVCPTRWQWSQFPAEYRPKISVIHDGIDTARAKPNPAAILSVENRKAIATSLIREGTGLKLSVESRRPLNLSRQDEVITYVARNLEPDRGFHIFMRALPELLHRRPKAHVLIVGGDKVSYGTYLPNGETYRERLLEEVGERIDAERVHFLGWVPYETFLSVVQISSAHVYLTYPFVLSWSMLEAMSAGCVLIGSKTPPVEEVIQDGVNGLLFDFFCAGRSTTTSWRERFARTPGRRSSRATIWRASACRAKSS